MSNVKIFLPRFLLFVFVVSHGMLSFAMTQEELDEVVAREVLMFEHHEDSQSAIEHLITVDGVSRKQLADSFAKVALRHMNAPVTSESGYACNGALYSLGEFATESQLTNLLFVAMNSTNLNAQTALSAYHARKSRCLEFLNLAENFLSRSDIGVNEKSTAWRLLAEDCDCEDTVVSKYRERTLRLAHIHVEKIDENTPYADDLLVKHERGYELSEKRRLMVMALLQTKNPKIKTEFLQRKYSGVLRQFERPSK